MAKTPYDSDLDRNPANYAALTPLSFIERAAYVYPERTALVHGAREAVRVAYSRVHFRHISEPEADAYWVTGEPLDKAGGYGIQGIGGIFVRRIEGSFSAIAGLPLAETEALLRTFGVNTWQYRGA